MLNVFEFLLQTGCWAPSEPNHIVCILCFKLTHHTKLFGFNETTIGIGSGVEDGQRSKGKEMIWISFISSAARPELLDGFNNTNCVPKMHENVNQFPAQLCITFSIELICVVVYYHLTYPKQDLYPEQL